MDKLQLILELCGLVEKQAAIIRDMALRLSERDDVDLAERTAAAQEEYAALIGTPAAPVQLLQQGETKT